MIPTIGKPKIAYKDHSKVEFESLDFYLTLAKKMIAKFSKNTPKYMLADDDAISFVANAIMMGDWRWKDDKNDTTMKSLYSYRNQCAIWAIKTYLTYNSKQQKKFDKKIYNASTYALEDEEMSIMDIIPSSELTPIENLIEAESTTEILDLVRVIISEDNKILTDKQKECLQLYFIDGWTLAEIGKHFNITKEAIRQSIKKALTKLRQLL